MAGSCAGTMTSYCFDIAAATSTSGYWITTNTCEIRNFGNVPAFPPSATREPCYLAVDPKGRGLWTLSTAGRVNAHGATPHFGEFTGVANGAWLQIEPSPRGDGYWLLGNDGGIFTFGAAAFHGSTGARRLNKPIVSMAATPSGRGYWLVAADGGIFAFGDAAFYGATAGMAISSDIIEMAVTKTGRGYWLMSRDGGVYAFGDARFHGDATGSTGGSPVVAATAR